MRRIRDTGEMSADIVRKAFDKYSENKHKRKYVFEKQKDKNGQPTLIDAEFYAFTGSKILISQAEQDFTHEDLPCPTIIRQLKGKGGQTFFKFT